MERKEELKEMLGEREGLKERGEKVVEVENWGEKRLLLGGWGVNGKDDKGEEEGRERRAC